MREIEVARAALRKIHLGHRDKWNANEQLQPLSGRFDERLNPDIVGNIVGGCAERQRQRQQRHERGHRALHEALASAQPYGCDAFGYHRRRCHELLKR